MYIVKEAGEIGWHSATSFRKSGAFKLRVLPGSQLRLHPRKEPLRLTVPISYLFVLSRHLTPLGNPARSPILPKLSIEDQTIENNSSNQLADH